jgi:hypothetical protein
MSTFPRRPDELYEEVADHLGPEFAETRQACRDTMAKTTALRYLAHYSSAVFDFGLDALGDPPPAPDATSSSGWAANWAPRSRTWTARSRRSGPAG